MKHLNISTKYSGDIRLVGAIEKVYNALLVILATIFIILAISKGVVFLIGTAFCLILLYNNYIFSSIISALSGIAKASEYYMAIIEQDYTVNEIGKNPKVEKFIDVNSTPTKRETNKPQYKEGEFVYCEPKGCVVVVLAINKNNTFECGMEDENGKMVSLGTFKDSQLSKLD